ncbi:putative UPF0481 protein At3g02645 [Cornus florida]|uniref:putative UPF0481 protein At3g02645 n=1 Tax=Cornus florida TaxID=4283 RepID=UPI00289CEA9E|nr:putative UPF0481 protein At3g02645 [Cornus florida]
MAERRESQFQEMLELLRSDIRENRSSNTPMAGELRTTRVHGMYRVPDVLRVQNEDAYRPSCVSIGPLWRGRPDLVEMEAVKKRYMGELLERNGTLAATVLAECTEAMFNLMSRVMECYSQRYGDDFYSVRDMACMVIDGCFIIELLYKNYVPVIETWMSDPFLQNHLKYDQVRRDLLLLENQIPFFVLDELFKLTVEPIPDSTTISGRPVSLRRCVVSFFGDMMMRRENIGGEIENLENNFPYHILHFLHICYQSPLQKAPKWYQHKEKTTLKYSATKLQSVGVKFGPRIRRESLFDLKFSTDRCCFWLWRRAHFQIPRFSINRSTELLLRNLIAFELCCAGVNQYFTSYAVAMSSLLDSAEDVELLEEAGVISNTLGYSEKVSELFKNITSEESIVSNQFHFYNDLWMEVRDFCTPWRLALANANTQMAVAFAIILNLITLLSSIYTVLSYYRN